MQHRKVGPFEVSALGLGCMSLSHAYGHPPDKATAGRLLIKCLDLGINFFDTAAQYGFGANEELLGEVLKPHRQEIVLASKAGMFRNAAGVREVDARPELLKKTCEDALKRLQTDVIDLYYLHRWDKRVAIEDSMGAMADLVREGKVKTLGISEVSAATLKKAHAVHPIVALQTEYSLWTRDAEVAVLSAAKEMGIAFVAFSPIARGFLAGAVRDVTKLPEKDIRLAMPRFQGENFKKNLKLLDEYSAIARENDCSMAQLALAWLLAKGEHIVPIPGTTRLDHLEDDAGAVEVRLSAETIARLDRLINTKTVAGPRYNEATFREIDTERA
ncbi:MAG TPA: aldo/keto reductase [Micropepsaceae bacterium]|nr:aldo/keto reductase [Micropepsaceae bacterium]